MKDDLISRQSLMAHFATSQALVNDRDVLYCNGVLDVISREPSVDAVTVVRCMECKERCETLMINDGWVYCKKWGTPTKCDGFCHKGEKMDGGAENK